MNADKGVSILTMIIVLAIITTLLLPGRQTAGVTNAFFSGFSGSIKAAMGR